MSVDVKLEPGLKRKRGPKRLWIRVLIALLAVLAVALAIATLVQERDTKTAKADIGEILKLPGGDLQVREDGEGPPIVLVHGYSASMYWWSKNISALSRSHRVIRIDLLGHGGSEKPRSGFSIENQAKLVAAALNKKGVSDAYIVSHSMGGLVTTALAQHEPGLVDRITIIGSPAEQSDGKLPFLGRLIYVPVLGHSLRTITPRSFVENGLKSAFAPGYGKVPDQFVDDYLRLNYNALVSSNHGEYLEKKSLPSRLRSTGVPVQVIFGRRDQIVDPSALNKFKSGIPGSKAIYIENAGHTPQYEKPKQVNRLILGFEDKEGDR